MSENRNREAPQGGGPGRGPHGPGGRGGFQKPKDLKSTVAKLLRYLAPYKFVLALVAVLLVGSSLCTVGGSYLLKPLINDYILPGDFAGLVRMLCLMGLMYAAGAACSYGYAHSGTHPSSYAHQGAYGYSASHQGPQSDSYACAHRR